MALELRQASKDKIMQVFDEVIEFTPEMMQKAKEYIESQGTRKVVYCAMGLRADWTKPDSGFKDGAVFPTDEEKHQRPLHFSFGCRLASMPKLKANVQ